MLFGHCFIFISGTSIVLIVGGGELMPLLDLTCVKNLKLHLILN